MVVGFDPKDSAGLLPSQARDRLEEIFNKALENPKVKAKVSLSVEEILPKRRPGRPKKGVETFRDVSPKKFGSKPG
jgi:hypothetical protein